MRRSASPLSTAEAWMYAAVVTHVDGSVVGLVRVPVLKGRLLRIRLSDAANFGTHLSEQHAAQIECAAFCTSDGSRRVGAGDSVDDLRKI
jgi:hypothetical protein